jgi:hypothetical protein
VRNEGSLVVFDKNATSMEALIHVVERQPRFTRAVASWLNADLPYLLLGTTGGLEPEVFALGASNLYLLLNDVLAQAAELLSATALSASSASAVDERLSHKVSAAWAEILVRMPPEDELPTRYSEMSALRAAARRTLASRTGPLSA